ncbi:transposase [Spirochaetota bacterium]
MSNPPRICKPNLTYHVYSRCIEKKDLMKPIKMKDLLIRVMKMAEEKYIFNLILFAIIDNHFHFFIQTVEGGATISRIMQFVKSQYARRYNKMMNRTGPFWNERFGDTIIEYVNDPESLFFHIFCYIGFNPVRKGYVNDPRDYEYSSYKCYFDETYVPPIKITFHKYFLNLGNTFKEQVHKFLEYEEMYRKRIFPESLYT